MATLETLIFEYEVFSIPQTRARKRVNEELGEGKSISRASIIVFLEKLEGQGVLGSWDATGKGGHHKIYYIL